jgi:hypothetical protein
MSLGCACLALFSINRLPPSCLKKATAQTV